MRGRDDVLPKEGSTGWSDTWMISSKAKHPNCMYMWMDHIICPRRTPRWRSVRRGAGQRRRRASYTADKNHCDDFHADDQAYLDDVYYWTTPLADCGDDRGEVCKDYNDWVQAWTEIKG